VRGLLRVTVTGFGLAAILILTLAAFGLPVAESVRLMGAGAFGDKFGVARTLVAATPLLLTGLGVVVAWRAGMYNIGGEGQFIVGGVCGATFARPLLGMAHPPTALLTGGILVSAVVGGAAYGLLAGWMRVKRGVDVVIATILLNFVAQQILSYAVTGPLRERDGTLPQTDALPTAAMLLRPDRQTDLHAGVALAALAAVLVWALLYRTRPGLVLRIVGDNPRAARANRLNADATQLWAMALSGGLCGLAGAIEYLGIAGQVGTDFSRNWGFLGIPVALLGGLHPLGLVASALVFGGLLAGSTNLARFSAGGDTLIYVVQGAAVLGLVALSGWRLPTRAPVRASEETA
jgi:simple sugar transport system permease protein